MSGKSNFLLSLFNLSLNKMGNKSTITINGNKFSVSGNTIIVNNDSVFVDGKLVEKGLTGIVKISWDGPLANLTCTNAEINGDVSENVDGTNIKISGNVKGSIDGTNITIGGDVGGDVDGTTITCKNVAGDVDAVTVKKI